MGNYMAGASVLRLTGRVAAVIPGEPFTHDFSRTGPEGGDGPAREAALLAAGAIQLQPGEITEAAKLDAAAIAAAAAAVVGQPEPVPVEERPAAAVVADSVVDAAAASTTDDLTDSAARSSRRRTAATDSKEN